MVGRTDLAMAGELLHVWIRRAGGAWLDLTTRRVDQFGIARYTYAAAGDTQLQYRWPGDARFLPAYASIYRIRTL